MIKELEQLNLTENDFKLITDGLDALPNKEFAGEMMVDLLGALVSNDNPEMKNKMKSDRQKERAKTETTRRLLIEDVRILQGKILTLQRYLRMNGLLKDANQILE